MRLLFLICALTAVLAQGASAAEALPRFRKDTHYPQVRTRMIEQGFEPVRILKRPDYSGVHCSVDAEACAGYPERFACSMTACSFLFVRRSDRAHFTIIAQGESEVGFRFRSLRGATAAELHDLRRDYVTASPAGGDRLRP